ncbi:MAG: TIM barrel protein [Parcubacteria group bacterium]|jgi:deoxyribonuclease-4
MTIRFGPAGLGGISEAVSNLEIYHKRGIRACEIAFTYGVYIKRKEDATLIAKKAGELDISLSIHAPYYINLNSAEKAKIEASKQRILECLKVGTWLNAKKIVFHPGYYGKMSKEGAFESIKKAILEIKEKAKQEKFTPELAPETSGKINVFGSINEIAEIVRQTGVSFCIDFAHVLARYKTYSFEEVEKAFENEKEMHIHFSGIEYGEKGEKHHKVTTSEEWQALFNGLPKDKKITIIDESPECLKSSVNGLKIYQETKR